MLHRGIVIRDLKDGTGLLAVNGKQYSFDAVDLWHSSVAPEVGMPVDVTFDQEGAPESVCCADGGRPAPQSVSTKLS